MKKLIFTLIIIIVILTGLLILSSTHEKELIYNLELKDAMLGGCIGAFEVMNNERCYCEN